MLASPTMVRGGGGEVWNPHPMQQRTNRRRGRGGRGRRHGKMIGILDLFRENPRNTGQETEFPEDDQAVHILPPPFPPPAVTAVTSVITVTAVAVVGEERNSKHTDDLFWELQHCPGEFCWRCGGMECIVRSVSCCCVQGLQRSMLGNRQSQDSRFPALVCPEMDSSLRFHLSSPVIG